MSHWQTIALDAPLLLEASAGTGKTFAIEHLVLRLIVERQLALSQILVLTYTRTAAAELASRIELRLRRVLALCDGAEPDVHADAVMLDLMQAWSTLPGGRGQDLTATLRAALESLPEAWIGTIHGLCQRLLGRYEEFVMLQQPADPSGRDVRRETIVRRWMYDILGAYVPVAARSVLDAKCFDLTFWNELARQLPRPSEIDTLSIWVRDTPLGPLRVDLAAARLRLDTLLSRLQTIESSRDALGRLWREHWLSYRHALVETHARGAMSGVKVRIAKGLWPWEELEQRFASPEGALGTAAANRDCLTEAWLSTAFKKGVDASVWRANPLREAWDQALRELTEIKAEADVSLIGYFVAYFVHHYTAMSGQIQTFDDIVDMLRGALHGAGGQQLRARLRRDFPAMIVDEFQDTDPAQWDIFRQLYFEPEAGTFIGVGDPKQAIYGFRGADLFSYLEAYQAVPAERRLPLTQNFRSDARYVQALNALYGTSATEAPVRFSPLPQADTPCLPLQPIRGDRLQGTAQALTVRIGDAVGSASSMSLAEATADAIADFLHSGATLQTREGTVRPVHAADVAVLVRSKVQGDLLGQALARRGIACSARTSQSVLGEPQVRVLYTWLRAMASPRSLRRLRTVLVAAPWQVPLPQLLQQADQLESEALTAFVQASDVYARLGVMAAVRWLLRDSGLASGVQPQSSRFWANIWHLCELADAARYARTLDAEALAQWLNVQALAEYTDVNDTASRLRLDGSVEAVSIMTMHAAKGLQFPVVFVPSARGRPRPGDVHTVRTMEAGRPARTLYLFRSNARTLALQTSELDADVRLLYVALTRAEHYCWMGYSVSKTKGLAHAMEWLLGQSLEQPAYAELLQSALARWRAPALGIDCGPWLTGPQFPVPVKPPATGTLGLGLPAWPDLARAEGLRYNLTTSFSGIHRLATETAVWDGEATPTDSSLWACLPAGTASGNVVHQIFEAFAREVETVEDAGRREAIVQRAVRDHGLAVDTGALRLAVDASLDSGPVAGMGSLRELLVAPDIVRRPEMRFVRAVPTVNAAAWQRIHACLQPDDPAYVFERQALHTLQSVGVREGLWQGAMDLVYQSQGRFGLLDYKTNTLPDYGATSLYQSVADNDYGLQMWIYWLTLLSTVRQLRPTPELNESWYAQHMGEIQYLYVRGMLPGAGAGMLRYRPAWVLTEALYQCFDGSDARQEPRI